MVFIWTIIYVILAIKTILQLCNYNEIIEAGADTVYIGQKPDYIASETIEDLLNLFD